MLASSASPRPDGRVPQRTGVSHVAVDPAVLALHGTPRALQTPNAGGDDDALVQAGRAHDERVQLALGEKGHGAAAAAGVEEDLEDGAVDDDVEGEGALVVDGVADGEAVGEEGVRLGEAVEVAAREPERRVAAEVHAAGDGLAGAAGGEGEVEGALGEGVVGDVGHVDGEVEGAAGDRGRVLDREVAVAEVGVGGEGRRCVVERAQVEGVGDEGPAGARHVGEVRAAGEGHGAAPAFELAGRHLLRVFPVADPGEEDGVLVGGDAVEELPGVVVLGEVGETRGGIERGEVRAVERAGEVLGG